MAVVTAEPDLPPGPGTSEPARHEVLRRIAPLIAMAAFLAALWLLKNRLGGQSFAAVQASLAALPTTQLLLSLLLTAANFLVIIGYDLLALRHMRRRLRWGTVATTATVANALGHNFGNTLVTGAAVRYWRYSAAGLPASAIARIAVFCSLGFWLGYLLLAGLLLTAFPMAWPAGWRWAGHSSAVLGFAFLGLLLAWCVLASALRGRSLRWHAHTLRVPQLGTSAAQLLIGTCDVALMVSVFHVLLPAGVPWKDAATAVLVAVVAVNLSLVPGGLGVFESVVVLLLSHEVAPAPLAAALLAYRLVYFLAPLLAAMALVGSRRVIQLAMAGFHVLLRTRPPLALPGPRELELARAIADRSTAAYAQLVLRGDKAVMFDEAGESFLMYGRSGRSWVSMGDPIGTPAGTRELRRRFRDLCDRYDGWCVFFEVNEERRADYAELGLGLTPVGEQARVAVEGFTLDTPRRRAVRQAHARALRSGCRFELVSANQVASLVPELAEVSQAWLACRPTREKGFSGASFDAGYLARFPLALVRQHGRIVAFANVWLGAGREEFSIDLMRHRPDAPHGTMDFLFAELLLWGRQHGRRWFDFGLAPLAGLEQGHDFPLWRHIGTLLYRHGEHFYHFEGLRRFKAKFDPVWTPLYLASPGAVALPLILVDVTALIAGGLAGILSTGPRHTARRSRGR